MCPGWTLPASLEPQLPPHPTPIPWRTRDPTGQGWGASPPVGRGGGARAQPAIHPAGSQGRQAWAPCRVLALTAWPNRPLLAARGTATWPEPSSLQPFPLQTERLRTRSMCIVSSLPQAFKVLENKTHRPPPPPLPRTSRFQGDGEGLIFKNADKEGSRTGPSLPVWLSGAPAKAAPHTGQLRTTESRGAWGLNRVSVGLQLRS